MNEVLQKTIEYLETLSPEVWRIAQQQVDVMIWRVGFAFWTLSFFSITSLVGCLVSLRYLIKVDEDSSFAFLGTVAFGMMTVFFSALALFNYADYVSMQMNPEFYAIEILLKAIGE